MYQYASATYQLRDLNVVPKPGGHRTSSHHQQYEDNESDLGSAAHLQNSYATLVYKEPPSLDNVDAANRVRERKLNEASVIFRKLYIYKFKNVR